MIVKIGLITQTNVPRTLRPQWEIEEGNFVGQVLKTQIRYVTKLKGVKTLKMTNQTEDFLNIQSIYNNKPKGANSKLFIPKNMTKLKGQLKKFLRQTRQTWQIQSDKNKNFDQTMWLNLTMWQNSRDNLKNSSD